MFNRWRVLTHKKVQVQLASLFLIWFAVFIVGAALLFLISFSTASDRTQGMLIHDKLVTNMLLVEQTREIAMYYGFATAAYVLLAWAYVIVYSHRLTGPVYKITKMMNEAIEKKTWPDEVHFRTSDAFHEMADTFNRLMASLKEKEKSK